MSDKCLLCGSKKTEKVFYETKVPILFSDGLLCVEQCYDQRKEKEENYLQERAKRGIIDVIVPKQIPKEEPKQEPVQNITINNIYNNTNNDNRVTNYNEFYDGEVLDKKSQKREEHYNKMVEKEKLRINEQKLWRTKRHFYSKCLKCHKSKHYEDYDMILDKNGEPIIIKKIYGIEGRPTNEEGEPLYKRKETCIDCLNHLKNYRDENKEYLATLKKKNTIVCKCGGKYFYGYQDAEYDYLRHIKTKKHQEYEAMKSIKTGSIEFEKLNRNKLREICQLNDITGSTKMTKQQTLDAIHLKQKELQAENKDIILE